MTLTIVNNGLHIADGHVRYAWFHLLKDGDHFYRCVALRELQVIPVSVREDYDLMGKQLGAVRGLHNAGVNFVYASMGIFDPDHIGIVQYFGAAGEGQTEAEAADDALRGAATVEATMANFKQSRLGSPNADWLKWYLEFVTSKARYISAVLGHPDPRDGKRGLSSDGSVGDNSDADLSDEQNEILFRGLAKLRQNFVFQVLAEHVSRPRVTQTLMRISEVSSNVASRRKGSIGFGFSLGIPLMAALGQSHAEGIGAGHGKTHSTQDGVSNGWGVSHQKSVSDGVSDSSSVGTTEMWGDSSGNSHGNSHSTSHGTSSSDSSSSSSSMSRSHGTSSGGGISNSEGWNAGASAAGKDLPLLGGILNKIGFGDVKFSGGYNQGESVSSFSAVSDSVVRSSAHMSGHSEGVSDGVSDGTMDSQSTGASHSTSKSQSSSHSVSHGEGEGWGESENWGKSHAEGQAQSETQARNTAMGITGGFSTGLMPSISINRSWQTEDDVAETLTDVLRRLRSLANQASVEGGFMTNAFLFTDNDRGALAAEALVPQAFHGPDVPTPVMTLRPSLDEEQDLRSHAFTFSPWSDIENGDPFSGELWTRYATLMTAGQLAALTAPGLFEEGSASTTMSEIPAGMGFYPNMRGNMVLGHQYSPETGDLTSAQVRLHMDNLMHTIAIGDTGFGKSVAMIRLAYETVVRECLRAVVLDFGAGWRSMLNAPGLEGLVNILQLWPDAVRPFRWNPLQIGRNIAPETQWRAFADVFGGIAQLGVKRQKQELLEAMRKIYIETGVLIDDPDVRSHSAMGIVNRDEANLLGVRSGTKLAALSSKDRQALAVARSSKVGLLDLYQRVEDKLSSVPPRDQMLTGVLEGILFRLNPLVQGASALQFAPGPDTVPVEDLSKPYGITIIEGGMFLDEFGKAFLLGWTGWHLYMDMVARRVHEVNTNEPILQIFYEEANKIFVKDSGGGDESGGVSATQRFADMFRDARKYKARLHVITQAPHLIADDIISSCSNVITGFIKNSADKDIVLSALARSEKGFRDEEWRRFIDDMPIGMAIGRFPYTTKREGQRPVLFRPLMLDVPEPTDEEIAAKLGRIIL